MTTKQASMLYYGLTKVSPLSDTEDSYFSDKHMMTNKELCGQVWGYLAEIHKAFHPNIAYTIEISSLPKNGAKFTIRHITKDNRHTYTGKGYTGSVYAVARKNNIIAKIIDIFQNGEQILDT